MPYDEYDRREDGQPEYRPGYSYYNTGRKQKRHTGLIVVLVVLAVLTGLASWAVNVLGVRVDLGQGSAVVTIGRTTRSRPPPTRRIRPKRWWSPRPPPTPHRRKPRPRPA